MNDPSEKYKYWNPYVGGTLLGVLLFLSFFVTSPWQSPFRTSSCPSMSTNRRKIDPLQHWLVLEVAGVLLGGFVSGLLRRRVRLQTYHGPQITPRTRWAFAFAGGILMGYGARLARGCTSGQALSGGAVLSVGSWAFMFAVFAGGYVLAWFVRRLWQPGA